MATSRTAVTPALVARLVADQFPHWADLPVTPVELDGWDNTTFRLGDEMSVRLPSAEIYAAQVEKEQRWLPILGARLPLPIPEPLARGVPTPEFPRPWSVYRWLPGEPTTTDAIDDLERFASELAAFLVTLQGIDASRGPAAGAHSFFRGGPLATYDGETRAAIAALRGRIDAEQATRVWADALGASFRGPSVWVHGDVTASNLLVAHGRLSAVLDFGCCAVGDPACDLVIAWTFLHGRSRLAFRARLALDEGMWARARGWALWKALVTLLKGDSEQESARRRFGWRVAARDAIDEVLDDR